MRCNGLWGTRISMLAVGLWVALVIGAGSAGAAVVGDPFPDVKLPDVASGGELDVKAEFSGTVGALVFMQTSCAACRKELLALKDLLVKYPQFKVVSVAVDSGNPSRVKRYKDHFQFEFPFVHDPDFKTPALFDFSFTPALVLVDKAGKIAMLNGGFRPGDEAKIEQEVARLLGL